MDQAEINLQIAHIQHGDVYFQVLNENGDDWDEAATQEAYQAWLATNSN
jgi:hypothetical protein